MQRKQFSISRSPVRRGGHADTLFFPASRSDEHDAQDYDEGSHELYAGEDLLQQQGTSQHAEYGHQVDKRGRRGGPQDFQAVKVEEIRSRRAEQPQVSQVEDHHGPEHHIQVHAHRYYQQAHEDHARDGLKESYGKAVIFQQQRHIDTCIGNPGTGSQQNKQVAPHGILGRRPGAAAAHRAADDKINAHDGEEHAAPAHQGMSLFKKNRPDDGVESRDDGDDQGSGACVGKAQAVVLKNKVKKDPRGSAGGHAQQVASLHLLPDGKAEYQPQGEDSQHQPEEGYLLRPQGTEQHLGTAETEAPKNDRSKEGQQSACPDVVRTSFACFRVSRGGIFMHNSHYIRFACFLIALQRKVSF